MDHMLQGMFGEQSLTKVAGLYPQESDALATARRARGLPGMQPGQVRVLGPQDARSWRGEWLGRQMEPEDGGIFQTLIRAHMVAGLAGAVAGMLLYMWLFQNGQPMVIASPFLSLIAIVGFAIAFGLLVGGLVTLRPDHVRLISTVRQGLRAQKWAVVVHALDGHQATLARDVLEDSGGSVVRTL
ncbi:hypothetical protein [Xylophilus sp.]|uniref:hypothetical protein n=1 Tax=Xylophilus sp. TaxID=2653893 RepID=UPI0013BB4CF5|nr:hypothetical protein [Xylophilus sp.]KAF1045000.1 MAG: hypothetical protein GAK38_03226 [Xylophilus sp.]